MKWTYNIKNKMTASGILLLLCALVLFSHYIDRDHTQKVKSAISTLYEDRLIAEEYILKMTRLVYQIKEVLLTEQPEDYKSNHLQPLILQLEEINTAYLQTKFTPLETKKSTELVMHLNRLKTSDLNNRPAQLGTAEAALLVLGELSAIQLDESKQIMAEAEILYLSGKTASLFVFALIIIILLVLQALVFASKSLTASAPVVNAQQN